MIELAELMRDGVVIFDAAGRLVHANTAAATIAGSRSDTDLAKLGDLPTGLVELRPAKWIELRHATLQWLGAPCRAVIFSDVTAQIALRESNKRLRDVGLVDPLTGLATAPLLHDHLQRALALAARDERWVGVLWIALQRFTRPSADGRITADEVLRQSAQRLLTAIRASDLAARIGDDTFAIALTSMRAPMDARVVAVRVLLRLAPPVLVEGRERSVRAHAGAVTVSDRSADPEALIERARDAATQAAERDEPVVVVVGERAVDLLSVDQGSRTR